MKELPTWNQFLSSKKFNESFEKTMKKDASLNTGDFVTHNTVGYRLDSDYENDPKEYEKLQKFLKGRYKPDPVPTKEGWFVVDEATGQVWFNNEWVALNRMENLESAMLESKESAKTLANIVSGILVKASELLTNEDSPKGWHGTVAAMKKHKNDIDNPYALAWHMKKKGAKPHYKDQPTSKKGKPEKKEKYKD